MSWTDEFIDRVPSIAISVVAGVFGAFLTLIGMWALGAFCPSELISSGGLESQSP